MRLSEVMEMTGLSRSAVYNLMARGRFPLSREAGERRRRWLRSEIKAWVESLPPATQLLKRTGDVFLQGHTARTGDDAGADGGCVADPQGPGRHWMTCSPSSFKRRRQAGRMSRTPSSNSTASKVARPRRNGSDTRRTGSQEALPTPTANIRPADVAGPYLGDTAPYFRCSFQLQPSQARPHGQWEQVYCPRGNMVSKRESMGGRGIFVVCRYPADRQPGGYIRPASGPTLNESISVAWACLVNRRRCWGRCKAGLQSARAPPQESVRLLPAHGPRRHARRRSEQSTSRRRCMGTVED